MAYANVQEVIRYLQVDVEHVTDDGGRGVVEAVVTHGPPLVVIVDLESSLPVTRSSHQSHLYCALLACINSRLVSYHHSFIKHSMWIYITSYVHRHNKLKILYKGILSPLVIFLLTIYNLFQISVKYGSPFPSVIL